MAELYVPLADGDLRLEKLAETHREALRTAAATKSGIWQIYPYSTAGTYLDPAVRGSGINLRLKRMMVGYARACGIVRNVFEVDVRNARSQAAIRNLSARLDGIMRQNKITWTGHVRDTGVFSLLPGEEADLLPGLS